MRLHPLKAILHLGVKELRGLARDPMMLFLIVFTFTFSIYIAGSAMPDTLHNAPIAIVDEDQSALSARITAALQPPYFAPPSHVWLTEADKGMDAGMYTFALNIPPNFQRDVLAGKSPSIQLNVDATRMSQAFTGNGHIQQIVLSEVDEFVRHVRGAGAAPVELALRMRFNPNLTQSWFGSLMEIINNVTMLSIVLTGAAIIREREHGTIEHLLVMPVSPFQIMVAKVWSMGAVVLVGAALALTVIVQRVLHVRVDGSIALWLCAAALHLGATTSMGIFMATLARSMPQFGLLLVLAIMPLQLLSGGMTPRESMPELVRTIMLAAPTTHFVSASQAILYRGAGLGVVWPQLLAVLGIGAVFFVIALRRFRSTLSRMA
ncbi:MAG: ABC-2 transporter permease [Phycisphaeraceae bacterium]|jgi:ABC-2 type transport system permease protein|nr:ABC-2 transporter permease [Phycisphaeraceae bacterium]